MLKQPLHRYLWCWAIIALVCLSDLIPIPEDPAWGTYIFIALIDYSAILLLIPVAPFMAQYRWLIASYAVYIVIHAIGFVANTFGIAHLYYMYPMVLKAILALQILIMASGYGNIRGIRRGDKGWNDIPSTIVSDSFHTRRDKEGN